MGMGNGNYKVCKGTGNREQQKQKSAVLQVLAISLWVTLRIVTLFNVFETTCPGILYSDGLRQMSL
ncbi:hypothetical protein CLI64_20500 [Nostoc sp. CENA543]|nr:hypothetical protein CLI64_20500 [Nostoc sp. CENA543]